MHHPLQPMRLHRAVLAAEPPAELPWDVRRLQRRARDGDAQVRHPPVHGARHDELPQLCVHRALPRVRALRPLRHLLRGLRDRDARRETPRPGVGLVPVLRVLRVGDKEPRRAQQGQFVPGTPGAAHLQRHDVAGRGDALRPAARDDRQLRVAAEPRRRVPAGHGPDHRHHELQEVPRGAPRRRPGAHEAQARGAHAPEHVPYRARRPAHRAAGPYPPEGRPRCPLQGAAVPASPRQPPLRGEPRPDAGARDSPAGAHHVREGRPGRRDVLRAARRPRRRRPRRRHRRPLPHRRRRLRRRDRLADGRPAHGDRRRRRRPLRRRARPPEGQLPDAREPVPADLPRDARHRARPLPRAKQGPVRERAKARRQRVQPAGAGVCRHATAVDRRRPRPADECERRQHESALAGEPAIPRAAGAPHVDRLCTVEHRFRAAGSVAVRGGDGAAASGGGGSGGHRR
mmetsp:Transcript_9299/g.28815  ORF Transcript_9299/g.28815 Transcript_9299/m.28815 type:complete len:458 (-) Transcript_9299:327-1700(-)